jgi:penicillin-binding protein 2
MSVYNQPRQRVIYAIIFGMIGLIVIRLCYLQLVDKKYAKLADANAVLRKVVYPDRGIIYDRKGRSVLNNDALYDLVVTPSSVKKIDTAYLCRLLQIDKVEFVRRIGDAVRKNGRVRPSVFYPLMSPAMYGKLQESMYLFQPGFELVLRPVRSYPYHAGANILGYTAEVSPAKLADSAGRWNDYAMGDYIGDAGLESTYEKVLVGQRGIKYLVKDNLNRPQGSLENGEFDTVAIAGKNLRLALDIELQALGEKFLKNKIGSIVAIDPQTGGVLAMVSGPTYDPNLLSGSMGRKNFNKLFVDTVSPTLNRGMQAMYPPGSAMKPLTALVALDEGVITPNFAFPCRGGYHNCGRRIGCLHSNAGHADNLRLAIANSCNAYFVHLYRLTVDAPKWGGVKKGHQMWVDYMHSFGLGHPIGIDLPEEYAGRVMDTTRLNKRYGGRWNSCSELYVGMGQAVSTTPLQMANAMCIIANKGYYYLPHLVESIDGDSANLLKKYKEKHKVANVSDEAYNSVILGMSDVITGGTGRGAIIEGIEICGKTGTAENFAKIDGKMVQLPDHSIFVAFAPRQNPKIAICVIIENAGFSTAYGVPIGSLMIEKYLDDTISLSPKRQAMMQKMITDNTMSAAVRAKSKLDSMNAAYAGSGDFGIDPKGRFILRQ